MDPDTQVSIIPITMPRLLWGEATCTNPFSFFKINVIPINKHQNWEKIEGKG
jgi:hypothetical protein